MKRATLRDPLASVTARRPLARIPVTKRAEVGCVGGLGVLTLRYGRNPTQGVVTSFAFRNSAGPQRFCLYRGLSSAWVPVIRARSVDSGDHTFSSGVALALSSSVHSFVLRDRGHIKYQTGVNLDRYEDALSYRRVVMGGNNFRSSE